MCSSSALRQSTITPVLPLNEIIVVMPLQIGEACALAVPPNEVGSMLTSALPVMVEAQVVVAFTAWTV